MTAVTDAARLATPDAADRDRVRAIVEATGVFRPDEVAIALEVFDEGIAQPGEDYTVLGAYVTSQLAGWAAFGPTPGTVGTWDLYWIAVDPASHGRGIGRQLMAQCEDVMERVGGRMVVVETSSRVSYAPTRRFYKSLGYRAQAEIPDYYAPGDGLIVFVKLLGSSSEKVPHG